MYYRPYPPDIARADATEKFQEITEAANKVFEFLAANRDLQPLAVDKRDVLGRLVKSHNLTYNANCVTFDLTQGTVDAWKKEFEKMLGNPKPLPKNKSNKDPGIQFKKSSWCLDGDSALENRTFGSISVSFWPTTLKVSLQGSTYFNFANFAIPDIVERMNQKQPEAVGAIDGITTAATEDGDTFFDVLESASDNVDAVESVIAIVDDKK